MISESAVCLDRRVENPPAVEAGGVTTWTLPYAVAVDDTAGRVAVVRLDTGVELAVTRPTSTTVSAAGSLSAVPVVAGLAYTWRYVPSTIYYRGPNGEPDFRAPTILSYVRVAASGTRHLQAVLTTPDSASCTVTMVEPTPTKRQTLELPVNADSEDADIELSSDAPWPVRVGLIAWEGQFNPASLSQIP